MARPALITLVGFHETKVLKIVELLDADSVQGVHSSHARTMRAVERVAQKLADAGVRHTLRPVSPDFDFIAWYRALSDAANHLRGRRTFINLTPSHAVAVSMATVVAAERRLPCVYYDAVGRTPHYASPSVVAYAARLASSDRALLLALSHGPLNAGEAAREAGVKLSTASESYKRLAREGFLIRTARGREIVVDLQPGVREFLPSFVPAMADARVLASVHQPIRSRR